MKHTVFVVLLALASAASAQPAAKDDPGLETVIVTAQKFHFGVTPNAIAHDFIRSYARPTVLLGTLPRWQTGICPETRGLPPRLVDFFNARLREIAGRVGAPVKEKNCLPNLSITFTPEPQILLDNILAKDPEALGYRGEVTITHPIQAWYATGIEDLTGRVFKDVEMTLQIDTSNPFLNPPRFFVNSPTPIIKAEGLAGRNGLKSRFLSIFIIVDTRQTGSLQVASVADYIAMLALARTEDYDDCQLMPSIANLLSSNCDDKMKPSEIAPSDIAYLRGVYKMDAGATLQVQRDQIAGEMANALAGAK
jgi:hypothetical protein